ncbi:hypothetical protein EDD85DRAFT_151305 [Armillaria nabsnona]|nr:hypothetical protein EDD85DRAFT_151305 [Armillaria nabsnona]
MRHDTSHTNPCPSARLRCCLLLSLILPATVLPPPTKTMSPLNWRPRFCAKTTYRLPPSRVVDAYNARWTVVEDGRRLRSKQRPESFQMPRHPTILTEPALLCQAQRAVSLKDSILPKDYVSPSGE